MSLQSVQTTTRNMLERQACCSHTVKCAVTSCTNVKNTATNFVSCTVYLAASGTVCHIMPLQTHVTTLDQNEIQKGEPSKGSQNFCSTATAAIHAFHCCVLLMAVCFVVKLSVTALSCRLQQACRLSALAHHAHQTLSLPHNLQQQTSTCYVVDSA